MSNESSSESGSGSSSNSRSESSERSWFAGPAPIVEEVFGAPEGAADTTNMPDDNDEYVDIINVEEGDEEDGADFGPSREPEGYPPTYWLGRTLMTEAKLDKLLADGWMNAKTWSKCRVPDGEKVPRPEPYEAVVFRDFFATGLRFSCETFVGEVLERFNLQIHQLTSNAFSHMGIYAMALKMMGCQLSVETFTCCYETQLHKNIVISGHTDEEMRVEHGSYNFVPVKGQCALSIVPAYKNKWPMWKSYWFYLRVCSDEDVTEAMENNLPKAHVLVSQMTPVDGKRSADSFEGGAEDLAASEAFAMTSWWQISRDLVEEWVAIAKYIRKPDGYSTNNDYVYNVEAETSKIVGRYGVKEHSAKTRGLGGQRRLNRVFDAMNIIYPDRTDPSVSSSEGDGQCGRGRRGRGRGRRGARRGPS